MISGASIHPRCPNFGWVRIAANPRGLVIKLSEDSFAARFQKYKGTVSWMCHTFSITWHQIGLIHIYSASLRYSIVIPLSAHFYLIESVLIVPTLLTYQFYPTICNLQLEWYWNLSLWFAKVWICCRIVHTESFTNILSAPTKMAEWCKIDTYLWFMTLSLFAFCVRLFVYTAAVYKMYVRAQPNANEFW